jgi:hypothetical protein
VEKSRNRVSGTSTARCSAETAAASAAADAPGGTSRPSTKANSASTTDMCRSDGTTSPGSYRNRSNSGPGNGPLTPMWACPAADVAAIFQP